MGSSEKGYVVEWRIVNLSHWSAEVHGDCIPSPQFWINFFSHLELFPKGINCIGEHLVVRLCGMTSSFSCDLSVNSSDGSLLYSKQQVNLESDRDLELAPGPKFEDVLSEIRKGEDFITVRLRVKEDPTSQSYYQQRIRTTLYVSKASVKMNPGWIDKIKSDEFKYSYIHLSENEDLQEMLLKICSLHNKVEFVIVPRNNFENPFAVEMCVRLTRSDGIVDRCVKKEHVFRNDEEWTFPDSLEQIELAGKDISLFLCLKTKNLIQSNYYTNFDCSNVGIELNNTPLFFEKEPCTDSKMAVFTKELLCVYQEQKFSDFTIKCDNVAFPVHKVILSARSPVLDRLLSSDMKEAASGEVEIVDLDPSTLGLFLTYLYTGAVEEELQCDRALKLYYAADKYQVPSLKRDCSKFLCANVSVSNVCDILSLGDRHQDVELTAVSLNFILDNYNTVLKSKEWDTFKKNEPVLVANTLTQFAVKDRVAREDQPQ